jgi:hypothetical protein
VAAPRREGDEAAIASQLLGISSSRDMVDTNLVTRLSSWWQCCEDECVVGGVSQTCDSPCEFSRCRVMMPISVKLGDMDWLE